MSSIQSPASASLPTSVTTLKVMQLEVDHNLTFALPMIAILKVMNTPTDLQSISSVGLLYVGQAGIQLLNPPSLESEAAPFLVIFQTSGTKLYGLLVQQPPDILELPTSTFHPLPDRPTDAGLLSYVKYVALLPESELAFLPEFENIPSRIYLLDLQVIANSAL
jgi:hypothetical protein